MDERAAREAGTCEVLSYKYAEFCGSDEFVIFTMSCIDANDNTTQSRVFLADLTGGTPIYYDIGARVQRAFARHFEPPEDVRAVFSTCHVVGAIGA